MSCEDLERVIIDIDLEKFFQVGVQLPPHETSTNRIPSKECERVCL